ncbi:MAG TPA: helix-turn-helix domain-containing protein, partial [Iamia sp.]|nr:helix-turn-helix domain-containing protein [Iamia sp.]
MKVHTARDIGALVRARRQELGLSQGALAERASVSRQWLVAAEAGKPTVELAAVLRVLAALDLALDLRTAPSGPPAIDLDDHLA